MISKSQVAIEYTCRAKEKSPTDLVFWISAINADSFRSGFVTLAEQMQIPGNQDPQIDKLKLCYDWLSNDENSSWLMILDNADDATFLLGRDSIKSTPESESRLVASSYLPQNSAGKILITSRSRGAVFDLVDGPEQILSIDTFDEEDAIALLRTKLDGSRVADIDAKVLVSELGFISLAIAQATAYLLKHPRMSASEYVDMLRNDESCQQLLNSNNGSLRRKLGVSNAIMKTWQVSFNQMKTENSAAADLLAQMSVLDRHSIPAYLWVGLPEGLEGFEERFGEKYNPMYDCDIYSNMSDLEFEQAIAVLLDYSFLKQQQEDDLFDMHRLVQLATRTWLSLHHELEKWRKYMLGLIASKHPTLLHHRDLHIVAAIEPHAHLLLGLTFHSPQSEKDKALLLWRQGLAQCNALQWIKAERHVREAIDIQRRVFGDEHITTLISSRCLANVLHAQNRNEEALPIAKKSVQGLRKTLGENDSETLSSVEDLSSVLAGSGRFQEAKTLLQESLIRQTSQYDYIQSARRTRLLLRLSAVLCEEDHFEDALEVLADVDKITTQYEDTVHNMPGARIELMRYRARIFSQIDRLTEAETLHSALLDHQKRTLGPKHPGTLSIMHNLAYTWDRQGRTEEAAALMTETIALSEEVLGEDHIRTVDSRLALLSYQANGLFNQADYKAAADLYLRRLQLCKDSYGPDDEKTWGAMADVAGLCRQQGQTAAATALMTEISALSEKGLGFDHKHTVAWRLKLLEWQADDLFNQGRYEEAEALQVSTLQLCKGHYGLENKETCNQMFRLAMTWGIQGRISEAMFLLAEATEIAEKIHGHGHETTAFFRDILQKMQKKSGRNDQKSSSDGRTDTTDDNGESKPQTVEDAKATSSA